MLFALRYPITERGGGVRNMCLEQLKVSTIIPSRPSYVVSLVYYLPWAGFPCRGSLLVRDLQVVLLNPYTSSHSSLG
jgi:hypothetical protein